MAAIRAAVALARLRAALRQADDRGASCSCHSQIRGGDTIVNGSSDALPGPVPEPRAHSCDSRPTRATSVRLPITTRRPAVASASAMFESPVTRLLKSALSIASSH